MRALGLFFIAHIGLMILLHNAGMIYLDLGYRDGGGGFLFLALIGAFVFAEALKRWYTPRLLVAVAREYDVSPDALTPAKVDLTDDDLFGRRR